MDAALSKMLGILAVTSKAASTLINPPRDEAMDMGFRQVYKDMGVFLAEPLNTGQSALVEYHRAAIAAIDNVCSNIRNQIKANSELKSEIRIPRAAYIFKMGMQKLENQLNALSAPFLMKANEWALQVHRYLEPESTMDAPARMVFEVRVGELRRQIQALPKGEQIKQLDTLAKAGDSRLPKVLTDSFPRPLNEGMTSEFLDAYLEAAVPPDTMTVASNVAAAFEEVSMTSRWAYLSIEATASGLGFQVEQWKSVAVKAMIAAWPDSTKIAFAAECGQAKLDALLSGVGNIGPAVDFSIRRDSDKHR